MKASRDGIALMTCKKSLNDLFGRIFEVGSKHVAAQQLGADDFIDAMTTPLIATPWILDSSDAFVEFMSGGIGRLSSSSQTTFFAKVAKFHDDHYKHFINFAIVQALGVETRDGEFIERLKTCNAGIDNITMPIFSLFSIAGKHSIAHRLMTILPKLSDELRATVKQMLIANDDSDDGF